MRIVLTVCITTSTMLGRAIDIAILTMSTIIISTTIITIRTTAISMTTSTISIGSMR